MAVHRWMEAVAAEADRRQRAGELPEALEREVDAALDRFAPTSAAGSSAAALLAAAERASSIDGAVPLSAGALAGSAARAAVRRTMSWYVGYVAHQANLFTSAELGILRCLDRRLSTLEVRAGRRPPAGDPEGFPPPAPPPAAVASWAPQVLESVSGVKGRILHAGCGDGWLVSVLAEAGLDAYGVDPGAIEPHPGDLDIFSDDVWTHLGAVGDRGLGGLVISGCVERIAPARARRLAEMAGAKLACGGPLVLMAGRSDAGVAGSDPLAELDGGRALHPRTWQHLFAAAGFGATSVRRAAGSFAVFATR